MNGKKVGIISFVSLLSLGIGISPSFAVINGDTLINSIFSPIQSQLNQIQTLWTGMEQQLQTGLETWLGGQVSQILSQSQGALGIPDPQQIRQSMKQMFQQESQQQTTGVISGYSGVITANEVDRAMARAKASGTLSQTGQQEVVNKLQTMQNAVQSVETSAAIAQGETVTQNVMKQIALQNARQAALMGTLQSEMTDLNVKHDITNVTLSNISEAVDSETLARQQESVAQATSTLQIMSLGGLY